MFTINICRTILLYPYITNQAGFDTGLTIANTSQDSFTTGSNATAAQSGSLHPDLLRRHHCRSDHSSGA